VINSFTPDSASAGTETLLTINGSNFGATRGSGYVGFKNADNGGSSFIKPKDAEYVSWSDNQIQVRITARAGSGKILVHNGADSVQSSTDIVLKFAMQNVVDGNNNVSQAVHIDDNGSGGYTWQFNGDFASKPDARQAFLRAFQNWRCGSLVNWNIGMETTVDTILRDGVHVIRFGKLPNGVLGRCWSWWSGCTSGGNTKWYVSELDIEFDDDVNWNYGPGNPAFTEYDFESVAVHELGHGHQLGHVIDADEIMHYSIANSQVKRTLSPKGDLEGGDYVMDLNATGARCGKTVMVPLDPNFCSLIPVANFGTSATTVCPTVTLTFTDSSNGSTNTYDWNFGTGATPATATGKGPHVVNYTTPGLKTIRLIVGGVLGDDTIEKVNFINVLPPPPVKPGVITGTDTGCVRTSPFTILKVTDATSYSWGLSGGGTTNNSTDTTVNMNFTTVGGPYTIWVKASNSCGTSADSSTKQIDVVANPAANFTVVIQNDTIFLTNTSTDAYTFTWKFGAGQTSNFTNLAIVPTNSGTYNISLLASNFCGTDSITKQVTFIKSGINDLFNKIGLKLYPNPAAAHATVEVEQFTANMVLELYDITGRRVQVSRIAAATSTIDVSALSKGVYLYKVISPTETLAAGRLVVE
ncbi:MAG TPA: PKD domain-containing protein, partial [Bacteroidia bacterium]|nr:PKD domain-containing protein [Bacteroidia bacterium]